ncbi:MAG TPA: GAF domain-containing protein [Xanthobacteraceae bacterium]|nr:GAF domain-containing protein [Xanthobacteraceae bacterium]
MKRTTKTSGKAAGRRKAASRKRPVVAKRRVGSKRDQSASSADLQAQLDRKTRELNEALEQQAATAAVLKTISGSSFDLQAVLDTLVKSAAKLCRADRAAIRLLKDGALHHLASYGFSARQRDFMLKTPVPAKPDRGMIAGRVLIEGRIVQIEDSKADPDFQLTVRPGFADVRTILGVPLMRGDVLIGLFIFSRKVVDPFADKQIELVASFADQAVIAIENARLLGELRQSLEQQTATADVLRVINSSPGALEPVFQAMLEKATRLCEAEFGNLFLYDDGAFRAAALYQATQAYTEARQKPFLVRDLHPDVPLVRIIQDKTVIHVADVRTERAYLAGDSEFSKLVDVAGARTLLLVPLLRETQFVGAFAIYRKEVRQFADKQIELVQNFAAQAVIAIENARLLNELRQSLEQQTATADVLRVISSSPGELEPVFRTILDNATRICEARFGILQFCEGDEVRISMLHNAPSAFAEAVATRGPFRPGPTTAVGRAIATKQLVHVADYAAEEAYLKREPAAVRLVEVAGARTVLIVPMLQDDVLAGTIAIYRQEVRPFAQKQIELLTNFAAQAVIAIENARLLGELRQRTEDLTESLEQQTATSEVLRVISSSPGDVEPVFKTVLENAIKLCDATFGVVFGFDGDLSHAVATLNLPPAVEQFFRERGRLKPTPGSDLDTLMKTKTVIHTVDMATSPNPSRIAKLADVRTQIAVPLVKDERLIGAINVFRREVRPFSDNQIELLQSFAAQAVIAIENTRLLNELRQSLEQQTATADVLKVISRSTFDLQTVLDTLVESAARLCRADRTTIRLARDGLYYHVASCGFSPEHGQRMRREPVSLSDGSIVERVVRAGGPVQIADIHADPDPKVAERSRSGNVRTMLGVPLQREGTSVGVLLLSRSVVQPFSDQEIALAETFADQAVIAIENVRLFEAEQRRAAELAESLEQQTATSEVLRVISSSPGELQRVFEAMLKNATRICQAKFGGLWLCENQNFRIVATHDLPPKYREKLVANAAVRPGPALPIARAASARRPIHVADLREDESYLAGDPVAVNGVEAGRVRTLVAVPLLKDREVVGAFAIFRQEVQPFTEKQIQLLQSFAAQAVIAIENARLLNELRESLEQQTATADVLRVISSSPGELDPVFQAMLENAARICEAKFGTLYRFEDGVFHLAAQFGSPPELVEAQRQRRSFTPTPGTPLDRLLQTKKLTHTADATAEPGLSLPARLGGARSTVAVPMIKEGRLVGVFAIYRQEVRPFTDKQIELVENFAAQAVIAIENTRLLNELRQRTDDLTESLEQQTATADVLRVISSSPGELQPVFDAILMSVQQICHAPFAGLFRFENGAARLVTQRGLSEKFAEFLQRDDNRPGPNHPFSRMERSRQVVHVADYFVDEAYLGRDPMTVAAVEIGGIRTTLVVPMLQDDELIGFIATFRQEPIPYTDKQIALVTNFAAQAVIAIENTRLLNELRESLEQQTATADVLRVISSSPGELEPVFKSMLANAARICEAKFGVLFRFDGENYEFAADTGTPPPLADFLRQRGPFVPSSNTQLHHVMRTKQVSHTADYAADAPDAVPVRLGGARSTVDVPMLKDGRFVGAISIYRQEVRPFGDKQIALLQNFANQAVIAIENARLLNELRESLEQQTATADVLRVISASPGELQPVFSTMLENAARICEAKFGTMLLAEGDRFRMAATYGAPPAWAEKRTREPAFKPGPSNNIARAARSKKPQHIPDLRLDQSYIEQEPAAVALADIAGARTLLVVPMLKDDVVVGVIGIYRDEVRPFSDKQVALLTNFAAQAVIAIENTRLLNELRQSLEQQTATADVLGVINASRGDLQPVFEAMVEKARRLCDADAGHLALPVGDDYRSVAVSAMSSEMEGVIRSVSYAPGRGTAVGRALAERRPVQISDIGADDEHAARHAADKGFIRTILGVPLLREGEAIGAFGLSRQRVEPFTERQIDLVENFAAQAVIAIENTRLLNELRQSLQQQTATADVLKIISRSTFDLQTVLDTLAASAARLCEAEKTSINRAQGDGSYRAVAMYGFSSEFLQYMTDNPVIPGGKGSVVGRTVMGGETVQIADVMADPDYQISDRIRIGNVRTLLGVPLLREGTATGVLVMMRSVVKPFTDKQIELAQTFADQAVIAIENVRLFEEIQEKSRQVEEASRHKSQFLANMSHELRTPLNAILGYTELILDGIYGDAPDKMRGVLERVQTNGKHLLGLINDVLDLSKIEAGQLVLTLNDYSIKDMMQSVYVAIEPLAGNKKLNFKLEAPPDLPRAHGDERRLSQVLLNLVGNAIKFTDTGEVAMKATAENGGYTIAVRDTGPGIAEADQAKIFEEFQQSESAQTKAKGGTGLGLAIAKRIVEMHGGRLWVESSLGNGSTFFFTVPLRVDHQAETT